MIGEYYLTVPLKLRLKISDLGVKAAHPLLHPLEHSILLLELGLDVIIDLDQDPVLIIHMTKSLTQHFQPLLSGFLLLESALLEIIITCSFASIHQESLQLSQPVVDNVRYLEKSMKNIGLKESKRRA